MKISFNVQGMTCAACSARVEKATSAVPGVASVAVNLLKSSMEVQLAVDANAAEVTGAIEAAVKKAGYGASPKRPGGRTRWARRCCYRLRRRCEQSERHRRSRAE